MAKSTVDELLAAEVWERLKPKTVDETLEREARRRLMELSDEGFTIVANAVNWEAKRRLKRMRKRRGVK